MSTKAKLHDAVVRIMNEDRYHNSRWTRKRHLESRDEDVEPPITPISSVMP